MELKGRLKILAELLTSAKTFADVGCDHGYLSKYMLEQGLCETLIFSDVAVGSLQKAETLLAPYVETGRAKGVLGNGFFGVPNTTEEVLIAGMGGEEIYAILSDKHYGFIPEKFVFQPMQNAEKVRAYLLENGGFITRDFTFEADGKLYDVICGRKKKDGETQEYTKTEIEFGKDNVRLLPKAFVRRLRKKIDDTKTYLAADDLKEESKKKILTQREKMQGVLRGENR